MWLRERRPPSRAATLFRLGLLAAAVGCASPGAPHPPSLHLPDPVHDLSAERSGAAVQLRFTVPERSTDGLPLADGSLHGTVCRQIAPGSGCQPVGDLDGNLRSQHGSPAGHSVVWTDTLPLELQSGPARPLLYRVEVSNAERRSAGRSGPAYTVAGTAPPSPGTLHAEGTRAGVLLTWSTVAPQGEVLLERQQLDPSPAAPSRKPPSSAEPRVAGRTSRPATAEGQQTPGNIWLQADPANPAASRTIDGTVTEGVRYRYVAVRRVITQVGGRSLEMRSSLSSPVEMAWHDIYPPPQPEGLTAVGFQGPLTAGEQPLAFAVDLVWQPVADPRVTGYLLRRSSLAPDGQALGPPVLLTSTPVTTPAFHDSSARADASYRYEVTAVDGKNLASRPASTEIRAQQR